jgi:hypothetical protein
MQNEHGDLNNHLFTALERLNEEELSGEKLIEEIARAKHICDLSAQIVNNQALVLKAYDVFDGSFGKMKPPSYFRKELALEDKTQDGKKTPLLFKRG